MLRSLLHQVDWRFVRRQGGLGGFGAAMAVTGAWLLAPFAGNSSYALLALAGWMVLKGVEQLATALTTRPDHWSHNELALLRRLAVLGWIILPESDGGYTAYHRTGLRQWKANWAEVEEFEGVIIAEIDEFEGAINDR
jgi:hypothetical protein